MVPLQAAPGLDKTGTPLGDLPQSVTIVPRALVTEQGINGVADAVARNVSGVNIGGSSSYGFFDRFTIRGMDARIYSDGFPDGDQSNGLPHSMNGVERIEVLKGPGSALFGTTAPGGVVNIVHFTPSATPGYGLSTQFGSFGGWLTSVYATGPTTVPGLTYRVDGLLTHTDGFRDLHSANYEVRPVFQWTKDNHVTTFALDYRNIERMPDPYGILYFNGKAEAGPPLSVPNTFKYSTPFSYGNQNFARATLTDTWWFADYLTINNRLAFTYRDVSILRNSGGGNIFFNPATNTWEQGAATCPASGSCRQLREQTDLDHDFVYQFEPVWKFHTGTVFHTLLTGAQVEWQSIDDQRATANLPNITNIFAPVIPETSIAGLTFLRDATHSGMVDQLRALYLSAYAVDQIDVTDQWKVRLSARQDHWYEQLTPLAFVPGRVEDNGVTPLEPGTVQTRIDQPTSWSVGTLYKILPNVAPFAGVSKSYLTNFNSEATSQGLVAPESGLEYEAGIKFSTPGNRIILTVAAFDIQRTNVFTENTTTEPSRVQRAAELWLRRRPANADHAGMDCACQHDLARRETDGGAADAVAGRQLAGRRAGARLQYLVDLRFRHCRDQRLPGRRRRVLQQLHLWQHGGHRLDTELDRRRRDVRLLRQELGGADRREEHHRRDLFHHRAKRRWFRRPAADLLRQGRVALLREWGL